jgi:hypothetical protein
MCSDEAGVESHFQSNPLHQSAYVYCLSTILSVSSSRNQPIHLWAPASVESVFYTFQHLFIRIKCVPPKIKQTRVYPNLDGDPQALDVYIEVERNVTYSLNDIIAFPGACICLSYFSCC